MEQFLASISRNLYRIPGGYYLAVFLMNLFLGKTESGWRTYTFNGIVFNVDTNTYLGRLLFWRGAHEWGPIMAIKKVIKINYTCIDVGANQGEYTLWMAKLSGNKGKVISFEPLSKMFLQLNNNIQLNNELSKRISTVKAGLSDTVSQIPIYSVNPDGKFADNEGMPSIFPTESKNTFIEIISLSTLDIELGKLNIQQVDFIKIDVEGAELFVLKGAINTLEKDKPDLLIEFNEATFNAAGYSSSDIFNLLEPIGYNFYLVGKRGSIKLCDTQNLPEFCNIIATIKWV
jgi:FkbM family methyltransferase